MAILTVNGKDYEGKVNFKFDSRANDKYNEEDKDGNKSGGFMTIYNQLLSYDVAGLVAFWDCAFAYTKERPRIEEIEDAVGELLDAAETDEEAQEVFGYVFKAIDESGFFRLKAKEFWSNLELAEGMGKTEEEKEMTKRYMSNMKARRNELKGLTTTN